MTFVLVEDTEQNQIQVGQRAVSTLDTSVFNQLQQVAILQSAAPHKHLVLHQDIVTVTRKKYTKVWHLRLQVTHTKVLENVGYAVVVGVYHTEQADKAQ